MKEKYSIRNNSVFIYLGLSILLLCSCGIQESHIEANIPVEAEFDQFLKRDLSKFMNQKLGKTVSVEFEFLLKKPTQSGLSYPKYYLWVVSYEGGEPVAQGAARLVAMDKKEFMVSDYVHAADILSKPESIFNIFPARVCEDIERKVRKIYADKMR